MRGPQEGSIHFGVERGLNAEGEARDNRETAHRTKGKKYRRAPREEGKKKGKRPGIKKRKACRSSSTFNREVANSRINEKG